MFQGGDMMVLPLIIMGVLLVAGGVTSLLLPETLNQHLPQTLQDGEEMGLDMEVCCQPPAHPEDTRQYTIEEIDTADVIVKSNSDQFDIIETMHSGHDKSMTSEHPSSMRKCGPRKNANNAAVEWHVHIQNVDDNI